MPAYTDCRSGDFTHPADPEPQMTTSADLFHNPDVYAAVRFISGSWKADMDYQGAQPIEEAYAEAEALVAANPLAALSSRIGNMFPYMPCRIAEVLHIPEAVARKHRALLKAACKDDADFTAIDAEWLKCCEKHFIVNPLQQLCEAAAEP